MAASSSEVRAATASRRIVDYLNDGEELGAEGAVVETPPCTPAAAAAAAVAVAVAVGEPARSLALPRFRWPRLVRHRLRRKGGDDKGKQEEVVVDKGDDLPVAAAVSTSGCLSSAASDKRHSDLGVGLSLVFLLAKTSDEFNKMVKVRTEMEELLKEIRDEVRIKSGGTGAGTGTEGAHDATKDRNRESTTSSCITTDGNEVQSARARMEYQAAASSSGVELAGYEKEKSSSEEGGGCCARMDVLEEEFHAEMELLQVNYGSSETPSFLPDPEEEEEHYSEPYDEMADYRNGIDDDSGGVVEDDDDGDGDDDDDDGNAEYNGVSAVQLERRLHELLHERNRDRIEELEAALRCAEQKLVEKEMEVSLWKDTAKFALREDKELQ
ncbi:protein POLAR LOCALIZATION DURING ASYMMETRIC DIVISION AND REDISTRIBUTION [Sorghum bicolor]|nr:protein POLAR LOCALIZATION DURING ASYMMETRIC DIVISION AND REDISTRIBUTION [Sorghum bicolor]|eukprot:XP_002438756.2 protein POLAR LOCALIZATION DURING ASYMMETRIC DIVISION AND REDISTRIBUTION [Sorghum bicolor]